jgi:hypothetical protein
MRIMGFVVTAGLLGAVIGCGTNNGNSSSLLRSETEVETLKLKSVTSEECGIWGEEFQKKPRIISITDMSCPGSTAAARIEEKCAPFGYSCTSGAKAKCDELKGLFFKGDQCRNVHEVPCMNTMLCIAPDQPATCQRQDGLEDDTSKPKIRIVGSNGQTVKTCEIYKSASELKPYLESRQDSVKTLLKSTLELEGLYYASMNSKTEMACLIGKLDSAALKSSVDSLKSSYKILFAEEISATQSCNSQSLKLLANEIPADSDLSSIARAAREFKKSHERLVLESKNISLLNANVQDKSFADSDKKALSDLKTLLKQYGQ